MTKAIIVEKDTGKAICVWPIDAKEMLKTGGFTQRLPAGFPQFDFEQRGGLKNLIDDHLERIVMAYQRGRSASNESESVHEPPLKTDEKWPDDEDYIPPSPRTIQQVAPEPRRTQAAHATEEPPTAARKRGRPKKKPVALSRVEQRAQRNFQNQTVRNENEVRPPVIPGEPDPVRLTDASDFPAGEEGE